MNKKKRSFAQWYLIFCVALLIIDFIVIPLVSDARIKETTYSEFLTYIEQKKVEEVQIEDNQIYFTIEGNDKTYQTGQMNDPDLVNRLDKSGAQFKQVIPKQTNPFLYFLLTFMLPVIVLGFLFSNYMKKISKRMENDQMSFNQGGFGFGNLSKSNAKVYEGVKTGKTFNDVAGQEEAKENLKEVVDFLKNPKKYEEIGAQLPKGVLLVGPPGTGKTLLAKAVAGEAGVPFFSISGSEFVEMVVGRGAAKVRDLFKQAREKAPCIVFIDEIDTIGKKRDGSGLSGNDEREQTLNQLLAEMDGFDGSKGVVLLAATNRDEILDPALTRPGRFDRRIPVELPDLRGREEILKLHAKKVKCSDDINFNVIARASAGASGAELANIVNESALLAIRDDRKKVLQKDMEEAIEIVIAGEQKKGAVISTHERLIVAYHEIGHALVAAKCKHTAPVHKITIIPRTKGALGYTMQVEENQQNLLSKEEIYQKIMVYTAGRCAEELVFHSITSGASNDIEQATKLARMAITRLGMSEQFGMVALETMHNQYLGQDTTLACSNETATQIDKEVVQLIRKAHDEAYAILEENKMKLHELAKYLYEKETITGDEFMYILNKPVEIGGPKE